MITPCHRCGNLITVWWWTRRKVCRDFERCITQSRLLEVELGWVDEPEPCPWANPPPEDIDVCSACHGRGEVQGRQDWETGAIYMEECRRCDTSGREPVCLV